jgi:putative peptidoglycan lipid II flippase
LLVIGVRPLVEGFFGFEPTRLNLVTWCTWAFLAGLLGDAWLETAVRSFYANQNTRTPLVAAVIQAAFFVLFAWLFSNWIGLPGIPIAAAITFTIQAIVLLSIQNRLFPGLVNMKGTIIRAVLAALIGGVVAYAVLQYLPLPTMLTILVAMVGGAASALPFIWKEIRLMVHL